jgi:hypothetical protein
VQNTGWCDAWEVSATLSVYPEGSVRVTSGGYTQYIGTLAGYDNWDASYAFVTWELHCKQACESTITVTVEGKDECGWHKMWCDCCHYIDGPNGGVEAGGGIPIDGDCEYQWVKNPGHPINEQFIEPDSITVKQVEAIAPAALEVVEVVAPAQVYVGTEFEVVVVVANNGGTDATGVEATISISPGADTPDPLTKTVGTGTIVPGDEAAVSWTLDCEYEGGVVISVSVAGTDTNTAVDAAAVQQTIDPNTWIAYLHSIAASLESIDGNVATINTTLGDIEVLIGDLVIEIAVMTEGMEDLVGCVCDIETILGHIEGEVTAISEGMVTIHTDLGNMTTAIGNIHLVVPDEVSVNSWYWLIGPILGGFVLLGVIVWFAVRKRPPAPPPPPPPTPGA